MKFILFKPGKAGDKFDGTLSPWKYEDVEELKLDLERRHEAHVSAFRLVDRLDREGEPGSYKMLITNNGVTLLVLATRT